MKKNVILASGSPSRKKLLEKLGISVHVLVPGIDEERIVRKNPYEMIRSRARAKMTAARQMLESQVMPMTSEKILIITADSMAVKNEIAYGKPKDAASVHAMLRELMGGTHVFTTHVVGCVVRRKTNETHIGEKTVRTKVTMRKLSDAEEKSYRETYDLKKFAGGFALDEAPWDLVVRIDGSYTNVIGLPFEYVLPFLRENGIVRGKDSIL